MEQKFFVCEKCGNLIVPISESGVPMVCCGQNMTELRAGTTDAAEEKHVPVFEVKRHRVHVRVGEIDHPMTRDHYIEWIFLLTNKGKQFKYLKPAENPEVDFPLLDDEEVEAVYAYCNIHGLWRG